MVTGGLIPGCLYINVSLRKILNLKLPQMAAQHKTLCVVECFAGLEKHYINAVWALLGDKAWLVDGKGVGWG